MLLTLPNILTVIRLIAAPLVALAYVILARPYADWLAFLLFVTAATTDWIDGYLARRWKQESRLGAMLDPIADKAMVAIALLTLMGVSSLSAALFVPAVIIVFRETFVAGLREYLGATAKTLKVTRIAKWKTTVQLVAISVIFAHGIAEHSFGMRSWGMDDALIRETLAGGDDPQGLRGLWRLTSALGNLGIVLIWIAAVLTAVSGWDYFRKALPALKEPV